MPYLSPDGNNSPYAPQIQSPDLRPPSQCVQAPEPPHSAHGSFVIRSGHHIVSPQRPGRPLDPERDTEREGETPSKHPRAERVPASRSSTAKVGAAAPQGAGDRKSGKPHGGGATSPHPPDCVDFLGRTKKDLTSSRPSGAIFRLPRAERGSRTAVHAERVRSSPSAV